MTKRTQMQALSTSKPPPTYSHLPLHALLILFLTFQTTLQNIDYCIVQMKDGCIACQMRFGVALKGSLCAPCTPGCLQCDNEICSKCDEKGYYHSSTDPNGNMRCSPCIIGCQTCNNSESCQGCMAFYESYVDTLDGDKLKCKLTSSTATMTIALITLPGCSLIIILGCILYGTWEYSNKMKKDREEAEKAMGVEGAVGKEAGDGKNGTLKKKSKKYLEVPNQGFTQPNSSYRGERGAEGAEEN